MEEHPELFSENAVHGVREYLQKEQRLNPDLRVLGPTQFKNTFIKFI